MKILIIFDYNTRADNTGVVFINNRNQIIRLEYKDVILSGEAAVQIFKRRGNLCVNHLEEFKRKYTINQYNELDDVVLDMWLIQCLKDKGINLHDILEGEITDSYHPSYSEESIKNQREQLLDVITLDRFRLWF